MSRKTISEPASADAERIADEDEAPPLGPDFFEGARIRVGNRILREATGTFTRRGRPPLGKRAKVQQSLRLSPEVIEHFRATGPGWQARIDEVLARHVAARAGGVNMGRLAEAKVAEEREGYRGKAEERIQPNRKIR